MVVYSQCGKCLAYCGCVCVCVCSPLHVAVVQADLSLVQQIMQTLSELSVPVDCYNNLRQVCSVISDRHCRHRHHHYYCLNFSTFFFHWEHGQSVLSSWEHYTACIYRLNVLTVSVS